MKWLARVEDRLHAAEIARRRGAELEAVVDGRRYELSVTEPQPNVYSILVNGVSHEAVVILRQGVVRVRLGAAVFEVTPERPGRPDPRSARPRSGHESLRAVMPGRVLRVLAKPGERVAARQGLLVLEAMKMENELASPRDGIIKQVLVEPGRTVEAGDLLVVLE